MEKNYKYIHFIEDTKDIWDCRNNNNNKLLGYCFYDKKWSQYVFTQADENIIFSRDCLLDIANFMNQISSPIPLNETGEK